MILCDGRHTLQVWLKRVTVLGPIRSNHLKTHRLFVVDPHQNTKMSLHFERGRCANSWQISQRAIKLLQVLKRSVEQSLSTKYVQTMTSNDRSTLRNFTRNVVAGECKLIFLIFDNQHNGREDHNDNKKDVTYRSEDASNFFNFMTVMIIISYILYNVSSELSVLSISLCTALVFCVIMYVRMLYTIGLRYLEQC